MNSFGLQCLHRYGYETLGSFFHHPDRTVILTVIQLGGFRQAKWMIQGGLANFHSAHNID